MQGSFPLYWTTVNTGGRIWSMSKKEPRPSAFVSYTQPDEAWAEWVRGALEDVGFSAKMQSWDSRAGENFVLWIGRQLSDARWAVCLYSSAYFASHWCTIEWTSALARQTLLPVRLEPVEPPPPLDTISWIDLFDVDETIARKRLAKAVRSKVLPQLAQKPRGSASPSFPGAIPGVAQRDTRNVITGNVGGNVVQARDVSGGIFLGSSEHTSYPNECRT